MPDSMRKMTASEFAKRLCQIVDEPDERYAFFLGAGCSVTSGIPASSSLVRDRWLPALRDFRNRDRTDLEVWAKEQFAEYDPKNPAAIYGPVMEELFPTNEKRQREVEKLCEGKFPGFGYGVLAEMVAKKGGCFNVVLTTNFDDLLTDALYLFAAARPLVITHEFLADYIRSTRMRPLIVKLHGDHSLAPKNLQKETEVIEEKVSEKVADLINDRGLIFLGYGGNDVDI